MRGEANGVTEDPPVWIYVMGTGNDRKSPQGRLQHGGYWRAEREWPLTRAVLTPLHLHADGTLRPFPAKLMTALEYTFDPDDPVPTIGGNISSNANLMEAGGYDQRPRAETHPPGGTLPLSTRQDVLVFRTDPLAEDLEVTGTVVVRLLARSDAPSTDFTAKLIDEIPPNEDYPLGFDLNIGDSIQRVSSSAGQAEPGVTITLYPTAHVFKRGHRIRLDVSSSNYPRFDVNPNTGAPLGTSRTRVKARNTIWTGPQNTSLVELPVILPAERGPAGR
jgi:putative CocE/NonD family hydrolase